jgi:Protein of unknown function (DUF4232)
MPRDRVSRLLDEFSAVTNAAPRPESPARRIVMRNRLPAATLTGASLIVVAVAVAAIVSGRSGPNPAVGSSPSVPSASSVPTAAVSTTSPGSSIGPCDPADLAARITLWEGAAGQRIAQVQLTNRGTADCLLEQLARPQLVNGDGGVLIDGRSPASGDQITVAPGAALNTLVEAGNYCKPAPPPPVSVAFVFRDGGRVVAQPVDPADATLPPCLGPTQPATIDMHPWAR